MITFAACPGAGQPEALSRESVRERLRQRILSGLHLGRLAAGQRLPSTRRVAAELGVNQRRVTLAYHELVVEGLVELRPRSGFYVAADPDGREPPLSPFSEWAVEIMADASRVGVRPAELAGLLEQCFAARPLVAACLECNDDQLYGVAVELESDYGLITQKICLERVGDPDVRASLMAADLLVTTAFHGTQVRALAAELGKPCVAVTVQPQLLQTIERALRSGDVYFVATDPRFSTKAAAMFATVDTSFRVRVVIAGRDDMAAIPASAATYVTGRAREQLGEGQPDARIARPPSLFAGPARRALLRAIAQANRRQSAAAVQQFSASTPG